VGFPWSTRWIDRPPQLVACFVSFACFVTARASRSLWTAPASAVNTITRVAPMINSCRQHSLLPRERCPPVLTSSCLLLWPNFRVDGRLPRRLPTRSRLPRYCKDHRACSTSSLNSSSLNSHVSWPVVVRAPRVPWSEAGVNRRAATPPSLFWLLVGWLVRCSGPRLPWRTSPRYLYYAAPVTSLLPFSSHTGLPT
jgi:hypothetical protein